MDKSMSVEGPLPHVYGEDERNQFFNRRDEESQAVDVRRIELVYR